MNGPHIQFFGTLTRDPEQCYSKDDGTPYARLRVAVRTRYDDDHRRTPTTSRSTCGATTWTQRWPAAGSDYYLYWRECQFLQYRSSMREQAEEALGVVLRMAGAKFGFEASVITSGIFTPPEVDAITRDYESGKISFSAANDIAFEGPDNMYSRERQLF